MRNATRRIIIVCDKKTEQYANYLRQLISANDDNFGMVEAAVWLEKDYLANKATVSSSEHVLFVGDNNASKSESSSMIVKYEKYGMKYGWLGKRAMMKVEDAMLSYDDYDEFFMYCQGYKLQFEKIAINAPTSKFQDCKQKVQFRRKVSDQQYRALVKIFYLDGLRIFLEG